MQDAVLIHPWDSRIRSVAVRPRLLDVETVVVVAVSVRDAVLDEIEPGLEIQAFAAGEVSVESRAKEAPVGGDLVGGTLGLAVDGFGVGAAAVPEIGD